MKAGAEIAPMITTLRVIMYLVYKFDLCALFRSGQGKRQSTLNHINHLIKVMEVVCIFAVCCALVAAYDTIKQHHAIKQLDKQLKQSLTLK